MDRTKSDLLIEELKARPEKFFDEGRGYDLLQEYFRGADISSLTELLAHESLSVRKTAVWIASELGRDATSLVNAVVPLLNDQERYIRCYALEVVAVCSEAGTKGVFHHVVSSLDDEDTVVRESGMFLISGAFVSEINEAIQHFSETGSLEHVRGLKSLLAANKVELVDELQSDICGSNDMVAMYGAIALRRYAIETGRKVHIQLDQIHDEATKEFLSEHLN